jgi:hypothetical protein
MRLFIEFLKIHFLKRLKALSFINFLKWHQNGEIFFMHQRIVFEKKFAYLLGSNWALPL